MGLGSPKPSIRLYGSGGAEVAHSRLAGGVRVCALVLGEVWRHPAHQRRVCSNDRARAYRFRLNVQGRGTSGRPLNAPTPLVSASIAFSIMP